MLNYEVSYSQWLLNHRLKLGATLYYINGKDMIQTQMVDGKPKNMNVGKFINKGFEIEAYYRFHPLWSISANYSYIHTDNNTIYVPKNKLCGRLMYTPGKFEFELENQNLGLAERQSRWHDSKIHSLEFPWSLHIRNQGARDGISET